MFMWMGSVRQAKDRFERSLATVHNLFHRLLKCILKLGDDIIAPRDPKFRTMHYRLRNPRFFSFFNRCVGAIDGTHVPMVVPLDKFIHVTP
jgi:hypothetical protein